MFTLSITRARINRYRIELQASLIHQTYKSPLNPPLCPPLNKGGHTHLINLKYSVSQFVNGLRKVEKVFYQKLNNKIPLNIFCRKKFIGLILLYILLVDPVNTTFAQNLKTIEIPGSITVAGICLSDADENIRYTIGDDLSTINASGFTIYNLSDQSDPIPIVRISALSDEEQLMLDNFKSIILIEGLEGAINNRFISKNFRLIGYFPASNNLLLNKNGFMYAIYSGITLYEMNYGHIFPVPAWEGGVNRKNAYILDNKLYDFHGIRSQHIYDLSNPGNPKLIATSHDSQIHYHHSRWNHDREIFEGCENLAIHPILVKTAKNEDNYNYDYNKNYDQFEQNDVRNQLNVEDNLGYLSHYIIGFRIYEDNDSDNLVLDIDSIRKDRYKSLNTGVLGIFPSIETGQFYINDYSGLYIFEKQSTKHNTLNRTKSKKPVILSSKNYPNPFNPQTTIEFELKENAHVSLKIYNALGQEITSLISENLMRGKYKRTWNGSDVASGVYFYRLSINTNSQEKSEYSSSVERIVLLK